LPNVLFREGKAWPAIADEAKFAFEKNPPVGFHHVEYLHLAPSFLPGILTLIFAPRKPLIFQMFSYVSKFLQTVRKLVEVDGRDD
jgi:hypothetical protein